MFKKAPAVASIMLVAALSVTTACGNSNNSSGNTSGGGNAQQTIGLDFPRADSDFWNSYTKYVPQFAQQLGIKLNTTNSQNDVAKLVANVNAMVSQGAKA